MRADWTMILWSLSLLWFQQKQHWRPVGANLRQLDNTDEALSWKSTAGKKTKHKQECGMQIFVLCGNRGADVKCQGRVALNLAGIQSDAALRWRNRVWSQRLVCMELWDQDQLLKQPDRSWVPILVKFGFLGSAAVLVAFHKSLEVLLPIGSCLLNMAPPREFITFFARWVRWGTEGKLYQQALIGMSTETSWEQASERAFLQATTWENL